MLFRKILYEYVALSPTLREQYRLRALESVVLSRVFRLKNQEIAGVMTFAITRIIKRSIMR
jgi:hypothetical protein